MNKEEAGAWANNKLRTDTSDGCTMAPDFNFRECCERHDMMIRYNQGISDKESDLYLRECIRDKGHPYLSWVYWIFVRLSNKVGGWQNATAITVGSALMLALYLYAISK